MLLLIALLVLLAPMVVNAFQSKARVEWAPTPGPERDKIATIRLI